MKTKLTWRIATVALLAIAGCHSMKSKIDRDRESDAFAPEDDNRAYKRIMIAQEAAGARADGMVYAYHFDGERLNSLGQQKLSLMIRDNDQAFPITVYMNVPNDDHMKARQDAVATYLADAGLHDNQMKFEVGPNPNNTSSAAQNLNRYLKTEDVSTTGSNPTSPQAPGYGTGGGPGDSGVPKP